MFELAFRNICVSSNGIIHFSLINDLSKCCKPRLNILLKNKHNRNTLKSVNTRLILSLFLLNSLTYKAKYTNY